MPRSSPSVAAPAWITTFASEVARGAPPAGLVVAPDLFGGEEAALLAAAASDRPVIDIRPLAFDVAVPYAGLAPVTGLGPSPAASAVDEAMRSVGDGAVFVVIGAHFLDPASVELLARLVGRPDGTDIGLLVWHRPLEGALGTRSDLASLDAALRRVGPVARPAPLTDEEVAARIASRSGQPASTDRAGAIGNLASGQLGLVDLLVPEARSDLADVPDDALGDPAAAGAAVAEGLCGAVDLLTPELRRVLRCRALAPEAADEVWASAAGVDLGSLAILIADLAGAGLLHPDGDVVPLIAHAVRSRVPDAERRDLERRLAGAEADGGDARRVASRYAGVGAVGPEAATAYLRAGDATRIDDPGEARRWYDRAVASGVPAAEVVARQAEVAARSGAIDEAASLADRARRADGSGDGGDRVLATIVLAAVARRLGMTGRCLELLDDAARSESTWQHVARAAARGLRPHAMPSDRDDRDRDHDRDGHGTDPSHDPDLVLDALEETARAVEAALADPAASLGRFLHAAALLDAADRRVVVPELPHVLGVATALVAGDHAVAAELLTLAQRSGSGDGLHAPARRAWASWASLVGGAAPVAEGPDRADTGGGSADDSGLPDGAERTGVAGVEGTDVGGRDRLVLLAHAAALARRRGDLGALHDVWREAEVQLVRVELDPWLVDPVAEIAAAAGRLDTRGRAVEGLDRIGAQLVDLDAAPTWLAVAAWGRLQVGIAGEQTELVEEAADRLHALPELPAGPDTLRRAAGVWVDVLEGRVDAGAVLATADALEADGRGWDAARLVGQAAIRSTDPAVTRRLLGRARQLGGPTEASSGATSSLSERELEVARLVVEGRTHKEIGAQLFLSPKTVEHHVARIRQKLGATTRAEMLAALRRELA